MKTPYGDSYSSYSISNKVFNDAVRLVKPLIDSGAYALGDSGRTIAEEWNIIKEIWDTEEERRAKFNKRLSLLKIEAGTPEHTKLMIEYNTKVCRRFEDMQYKKLGIDMRNCWQTIELYDYDTVKYSTVYYGPTNQYRIVGWVPPVDSLVRSFIGTSRYYDTALRIAPVLPQTIEVIDDMFMSDIVLFEQRVDGRVMRGINLSKLPKLRSSRGVILYT